MLTKLFFVSVASKSFEWTTIPAQNDKDVTGIVYHGTGQDHSDMQRLITNYKINIASLWKSVRHLKAFRYSSNMSIIEGKYYVIFRIFRNITSVILKVHI